MIKTVLKIVCSLGAFTLLSLNVFAEQNNTLFLGKLDLRAKAPIKELNQISTDLAIADNPHFFDRNHLYYTQVLGISNKQEADVFVWDLSKNSMRGIARLSKNQLAAASAPKDFGFLLVREKDNDQIELRAINVNGNPETYLAQNGEGVPTSINTHQFEKSNWYLYAQNQQQNELKAYNTKSKKTIVVSELPQGSEYFSVSATGHLIASDGSKLYQRQIIAKGEYLQAEGDWSPMIIESEFCQSGITKTAISPYGETIALICSN
ncbi:MAG: hypothetical protein ACJAYN_000492 [Bermanella sp.]|jgi:hypothetical protein|uniref:hypothetical protein n=1 Tax=Glaciecola sp. 33A TaxID=2057807 RepID=UPI001E5F561A|nr:hypothetical protein [Glaciecola sp. 33A]